MKAITNKTGQKLGLIICAPKILDVRGGLPRGSLPVGRCRSCGSVIWIDPAASRIAADKEGRYFAQLCTECSKDGLERLDRAMDNRSKKTKKYKTEWLHVLMYTFSVGGVQRRLRIGTARQATITRAYMSDSATLALIVGIEEGG